MAAIEMPPGNWLAGEIRRFQEKSTGLFPEPQPGDERIRYNSMYTVDYAPLTKEAYNARSPALLRRPGIKKEAPFQLEQAKRFNTWKIKKNLVEVDKVQQRVAERRRTALEQAQRTPSSLNLPKILRSQTVVPPSIVTPVLPPPPQLIDGEPQISTRSRQESVRMTAPASIGRESYQAVPSAAHLADINEHLLQAAGEYMERRPQDDRRVIDKALQISNKHFRQDPGTIAKRELADPKIEAERWLEKANPQEQEIAVRFFKSLGGMRLMGADSQKKRIDSLIHTLENGEAKVPIPKLSYEQEQVRRERKQRNLQFVRLLSPSTRNNRSALQTWHHLPDYRPANRADNVRSHYTQPQKVKPLHFSIHPEWGMN